MRLSLIMLGIQHGVIKHMEYSLIMTMFLIILGELLISNINLLLKSSLLMVDWIPGVEQVQLLISQMIFLPAISVIHEFIQITEPIT